MSAETGIAWTDHTFNPWWGCQRVSPGCERCYAETWDARWKGGHWGPNSPRRFFGDAHWNEPRKWNRDAEKEGRRHRVFCASMADVFEDRRDLDEQRARLWRLIAETPHLDWQLLTKRPENIARLAPPDWNGLPLPNVWMGTTVEDRRRRARIEALMRVPAAVRFLSIEPLLEDLGDLQLAGTDISWVIVGGESGPGARPFDVAWARSLIAQCAAAGTACFVKQLGSAARLRHSHGGDPAEWPADLRVRQFPQARSTEEGGGA